MKMFYVMKSLSPFLFLMTAPRVVDVEMGQHSFFSSGDGALVSLLVQTAFAAALFGWIAALIKQKKESAEFLTMSCVSKKVFHRQKWISVEQYLSENHNITVSHGLTPEECADWKRQAVVDAGCDFFRDAVRIEKPSQSRTVPTILLPSFRLEKMTPHRRELVLQ